MVIFQNEKSYTETINVLSILYYEETVVYWEFIRFKNWQFRYIKSNQSILYKQLFHIK